MFTSRVVEVQGDNLPVIRFAACSGRLRDPSYEALLSDLIASMPRLGFAIRYHAVRRRFNKAADAVATDAVFAAARRREAGYTSPEVTFRWVDD